VLVLSAGASVVGAYTGNNIALNGSDALFEVTQEVFASCPGTVGSGDSYVGGGSGVGVGQMLTAQQRIAPMSRALKNNEFCGLNLDLNPGGPLVAIQGTTESLMIALDGVSMFANMVTSCGANGISNTGTITVVDAGGNPVNNCTGCTPGTNSYVLQSSLDALKIIYAGALHDGTIDCASPVRSSLANNWASVFAQTCAGQAACSQLRHAWRPSDLSGTTDAFLTALGITGRGIGTLPIFANGSPNRNPFCNSLDANPTSTRATIPSGATAAVPACTTQPLTSVTCPNGSVCPAGQLCNAATNTCVNNACTLTGCPVDQVCRPDGQCVVRNCPSGAGGPYGSTLALTRIINTRACDGPNGFCTFSFGGSSDFTDLDPIRRSCDTTSNSPDQACEADGTYGVVTVILLPDTAGVTLSDAYPTTNCQAGVFDLQTTGNPNLPCPGGPQFLGKCFQPLFTDVSGNNFNCLSNRRAKAFGSPAGVDGRVWNMQVKKADFTFNPPRLAAYVKDPDGRLMTQANFRWHVTNTTGAPTCQLGDATAQIGCLVNADTCSVGYAGGEANQPGNQPLLVNNIAPTNSNISNLLTGTLPVYPIARRLYLTTLVGFGNPNLAGGENELAKCFADNAIVRAAVTAHSFVNLPVPGIQCLDYDETLPGNASPLPGCGSLTNTDACRLTPPGTAADTIGAGAVSAGGSAANLILNPLPGAIRAQAQVVVNNRCVSCHNSVSPAAGLDLTDLQAVVGIASTQSSKPIIPAIGDPTNSYLVDKIKGITQTVGTGVSAGALPAGSRMPNAAAGLPQLSPSDINIIVSWI
jgi:hypothetical protein